MEKKNAIFHSLKNVIKKGIIYLLKSIQKGVGRSTDLLLPHLDYTTIMLHINSPSRRNTGRTLLNRR